MKKARTAPRRQSLYIMVNVPFVWWWKIGISNRTDLRKKQVSAAAPGLAVPIGVFWVGNALAVEHWLHQAFAPLNVRYYKGDGHSEWFWFPAGMAAWLIGAGIMAAIISIWLLGAYILFQYATA